VNERIRAREVRLIDENGAQLGIMPTREALRVARERELDLIEVAPNAQPPVCRIMDYGKHKYQVAKREREAHRRSKGTEVRVLVFRNPRIDPHDLQIKLRKLRQLLGEGNKVRINLRLRGRELSHPELGTQLLNRISQELTDIAQTEMSPRFEGRLMNMLLAPKPHVRPAPAAKPAAAPPAPPAPPSPPAKAIPDVETQVQQGPVQPPVRQVEDAEDSGEAG
jgi:translation initiation factor IF-3